MEIAGIIGLVMVILLIAICTHHKNIPKHKPTENTDGEKPLSLSERKVIYEEKEKKRIEEIKGGHEDDLYEDLCQTRNAIAWIPLLIGLFLLIFLWIAENYVGAILCLLGSLIVTLISLTFASYKNVNDAKYYDLTEASDKRIKKEKTNKTAGIVGTSVSTYSIIKNTKNAIKDISNPESWNEFK